MTDKVIVNQTQGLGSSGSQDILIDQSIHNYPLIYQNLVKTHKGAITFDPNSIRTVIVAIAAEYEGLEKKSYDLDVLDIEEKNELNNLSDSFYEQIISRDYEPYFFELDAFFSQRGNEDLQGLVGKIANNLNKKILAGRGDFETFEELIISIENVLLDSQYNALVNKESSISLFLFYLYVNCFIGVKTKKELLC
jgi:hypothetical protein